MDAIVNSHFDNYSFVQIIRFHHDNYLNIVQYPLWKRSGEYDAKVTRFREESKSTILMLLPASVLNCHSVPVTKRRRFQSLNQCSSWTNELYIQ